MKTIKKIKLSKQLVFESIGKGLEGVNIFAHEYPIEPFLVVTEYHMNAALFGPHPHAGVSVLTYILPESEQGFINRDSNGDFSYIEPGGFHITQAGSGIHHDEFPKKPGVDAHGFQLWINHSEVNRNVKPMAIHADKSDIFEISNDHYRIRLLLGELNAQSANHKIVTPLNLYDVYINPYSNIELESLEMTFIYGINGRGIVANTSLEKQSLTVLSKEGNTTNIQTKKEAFHFLFASAKPLNEPIVYGGPFVMTTKEQMKDARKRLGRGEMGYLEPYNQ